MRLKKHVREIKANIKKYGWHCCNIFDPNRVDANFSYTIGLHYTFGHPEIIIFGLEHDASHQILSCVVDDIKTGAKFETDTKLSNVIGGEYKIMFKEVMTEHFNQYLGQAVDYYKKPFRAWVMLLPDKDNLLPTEEGSKAYEPQSEALKLVSY